MGSASSQLLIPYVETYIDEEGYRLPLFDVYNLQNGEYKKVGTVSPDECILDAEIVYPGGTRVQPSND